jgi:hypothetical protein
VGDFGSHEWIQQDKHNDRSWENPTKIVITYRSIFFGSLYLKKHVFEGAIWVEIVHVNAGFPLSGRPSRNSYDTSVNEDGAVNEKTCIQTDTWLNLPGMFTELLHRLTSLLVIFQ